MKDTESVVENIRSQYTDKAYSQLDELKVLDAKVRGPANVFGYTYGIMGAIVMGTGMSLVLSDIGTVLGMNEGLLPGIGVGILGLAMSYTTYPIYQKILSSRKRKYAGKIIALSDHIMKG